MKKVVVVLLSVVLFSGLVRAEDPSLDRDLERIRSGFDFADSNGSKGARVCGPSSMSRETFAQLFCDARKTQVDLPMLLTFNDRIKPGCYMYLVASGRRDLSRVLQYYPEGYEPYLVMALEAQPLSDTYLEELQDLEYFFQLLAATNEWSDAIQTYFEQDGIVSDATPPNYSRPDYCAAYTELEELGPVVELYATYDQSDIEEEPRPEQKPKPVPPAVAGYSPEVAALCNNDTLESNEYDSLERITGVDPVVMTDSALGSVVGFMPAFTEVAFDSSRGCVFRRPGNQWTDVIGQKYGKPEKEIEVGFSCLQDEETFRRLMDIMKRPRKNCALPYERIECRAYPIDEVAELFFIEGQTRVINTTRLVSLDADDEPIVDSIYTDFGGVRTSRELIRPLCHGQDRFNAEDLYRGDKKINSDEEEDTDTEDTGNGSKGWLSSLMGNG